MSDHTNNEQLQGFEYREDCQLPANGIEVTSAIFISEYNPRDPRVPYLVELAGGQLVSGLMNTKARDSEYKRIKRKICDTCPVADFCAPELIHTSSGIKLRVNIPK